MSDGAEERRWIGGGTPAALAAIAYVAAVLLVDTLATQGAVWPIDWTGFRGFSPGASLVGWVDRYKLAVWFVVPLVGLAAARSLDWQALGTSGIRRIDVWILAGLGGAGFVAVVSIPFLPGLRDWYPSAADASVEYRVRLSLGYLIWTLSWLPGWELLHRYVLVGAFAKLWPRATIPAVAASEILYHLVKSPFEAIGVAIFSPVLTWWTLRRRNVLLPFLAHLIIEVELILFLVLV